MANSKLAAPAAPALALEALRDQHGVGRAVFAGVCAAQGWKPGRAVAEAEFLAAVRAFGAAPMGGKEGTRHAP